MVKKITKPTMSAVTPDDEGDTVAGRVVMNASVGMVALKVGQLTQRFDGYVDVNEKQVDMIRNEVREVKDEVNGIGDKIDGVEKHVGNLRVDVAKLTTTTENLNIVVNDQQKIKTVTMIAEIDDAADRRKAKRAFWLKVGVVFVGLAGTIAGMFIEHFR